MMVDKFQHGENVKIQCSVYGEIPCDCYYDGNEGNMNKEVSLYKNDEILPDCSKDEMLLKCFNRILLHSYDVLPKKK